MGKYAMLDRQGRPWRVCHRRPHPAALPVEYPDLSHIDRLTHRIRQTPVHDWEVLADRVVVSYEITPRDLQREKARLASSVRQRRKEVESSGITVAGMMIRTDSGSRSRIFDLVAAVAADDQAGPFDFEIAPGRWETVDRDTVLAIGKGLNDHIQDAFSRQRSLEEEIAHAEDLHALADVDIAAGWPG